MDKEHQLQVGPEGKHATIHLGPQAAGLEKKGIKTRIGNKNQKIKIANRKAELQAALLSVEKELQKDKEMIEAQRKAIAHLKEKEDYNQYISGHELRNNFRQIFAAVVIEMQMNQGKIDECEKKLHTDKQISSKAMNIVTIIASVYHLFAKIITIFNIRKFAAGYSVSVQNIAMLGVAEKTGSETDKIIKG